MGILASTIAPAVAPAVASASGLSSASARGGGDGSTQTSRSQAVLGSQAALVITLSAESKNRAASSSGGDGKKVDAGFAKQEAQGKDKEINGKTKEETNSRVDLTA